MQVDPIKPVLKAPGTEHLILKYDQPLSNFAFKFNMRRYMEGDTQKDVDAAADMIERLLVPVDEAGPARHPSKP